jgi:4-hydroxy-tetrahydrodipicolinate synthase
VRTGRKIAHDTMMRLAAVPTIVGVKDAAGDPAAASRVIAEAPADFVLYSGDDALTLPLLAVGAVGVISVAGNWAPAEMGEMVATFAKGDVEAARALNARLLESYAFESSESYPNPIPAKAACRALGLPAGQCRLPLGDAPAELDERARAVLAGLDRSKTAGAVGAAGAAGAGAGRGSPPEGRIG